MKFQDVIYMLYCYLLLMKKRISGKWHLGFCKSGYLPTNRGFQHHYGHWLGAQVEHIITRKWKFDFQNYQSTNNYKNLGTGLLQAHKGTTLWWGLRFQARYFPNIIHPDFHNAICSSKTSSENSFLKNPAKDGKIADNVHLCWWLGLWMLIYKAFWNNMSQKYESKD